ncbi:MAG: hypothetical protein ACKOET_10870 [Verrucomicrobiota bacterium]
MKNTTSLLATAAALFLAAGALHGADKPKDKGKPKPYPLKTCIVSDEELGSMGKPVVFNHEGQEIKLCCKNCRADFDKDPAKHLAKLKKK